MGILNDKIESYTAASTFPTKLLHKKVVENGKIIPIHIQVSPTNACNLHCDFCSCSDRDRKKSLSLEQLMWIIDVCTERGTKAMTVTGGGEPLIHPQINDFLKYANQKGIEIGLVTNGIPLDKLSHHSNLTWCRISSSDDRFPAYKTIERALNINPRTDWAFSHVVTRNPNYEVIKGIIDFANEYDFTHVRLVSDLNDLDNVPDMETIRLIGKFRILEGIDDSKVIYQGRKDSTKGIKDCYISLLKPVIAPEGVFPCCGVQYAIYGQSRDMIDKMRMGKIEDLPEILDKQLYFDGSICDVCYYGEYNSALKKLLNKPNHLNFV